MLLLNVMLLLNGPFLNKKIISAWWLKYMQVLDVVWNKLFKGKIQETYDWLANGKHEYTAAGNMKSVPRMLVVPNETVAISMKSCALALSVDGTEDGLIS